MGTERDFVVKKGLKVAEGITLGGHTFDDIDIGSEFVDADDHIMSSGAIKEKIESYSYGTGDVTLTGVQTLTNKTIAVSQVTELSNLTAVEGAQLENIGSTTISATQWGYLGAATGAITNTDTNTEYTAGTNISLSGTTFNVDDAFLFNDRNDTTTGTITAAGFTTTGSIGRDSTDQIKFSTDNQIIFRVDGVDGVTFKTGGEIEATKFDGNLEGNADTATQLSIKPNDILGSFEDEDNLISFVAGGGAGETGGFHALEVSDAFHYNPSTTILTVPKITSTLTGNVTGTATNATAITLGGHLINDVDIGTELVDTDDHIMSSGAIKAYVDANAGGSGDVSKVGTPANHQIGVWTGDGTIEGNSNFTWDGDASVPQLQMISTNDNSGWGPELSFYRNSASPLANDGLGVMRFYGEDTADNKQEYARIRARVADANSGSEDAYLKFGTVNAGTLDEDMFVLYAGGVSGTVIKNEDDFASDSDTHLATQQSIKAYVDANAGGGATDLDGLTDVISNITNFTNSILISPDGSAPPHGTLNGADYNVGIGKDVFESITSGSYNVGFGYDSLTGLISGSGNIGIGYAAFGATTTGGGNVGIGHGAGKLSTGSTNVAIGKYAMFSAGNSNSNVSVGYSSGYNITDATGNTLLGADAGNDVTSGNYNTLLGFEAGAQISTGYANVAIGRQANRYGNGNDSIAIGYGSLSNGDLAGDRNIGIGYMAGNNITSGDGNVVIGNADVASAAGDNQLSISSNSSSSPVTWITGNSSGVVNIPGSLTVAGSAVGGASTIGALDDVMVDATDFTDSFLIQPDSDGLAPTTGTLSNATGNTGIGIDVLSSLTSGQYNVGFGDRALRDLTSGDHNICIGQNAGREITNNNYNVMIGRNAGMNTNDGANVCIGWQAMALGNGNSNVAVGYNSLFSTTGQKNLGLGTEAGDNLTSGNYNVIIGKGDVPSATSDSQLVVADGSGNVTWITGNEDGIVLGALTPLFYERAALDTSAVDFRVPTVQSSTANPNGYPMPFAGKVVAASFLFAGSAISTSGNTNTIRIRKNGGTSGSDIKDFTFTEGDLNNTNGNQYSLVKSGSDVLLTFAAGDVIQVKRQGGSTDLNNSQAMLWVSYNF